MAIAACLIDTNVLLRITRRSDPVHQVVDMALGRLAIDGTILHYTHQNIAELWNAMTRPVTQNGFGLSVHEVEQEVRLIESGMMLLPDNEAVYREWRRLVLEHRILGVRVHDARLVAAMHVHAVSHILTLNTADFGRFKSISPIDPTTLRTMTP